MLETSRTGSASGRVKTSPDSLRRRFLLLLVIVVAIAVRTFHFARDPSMWHDEAALVLNVLQKSFGELLGPLRFAEAAPPLFLWVERGVILSLGDSTCAVRLAPFAASCLVVVRASRVGQTLGGRA